MCQHLKRLEIYNVTVPIKKINSYPYLGGDINHGLKYDQVKFCANPVCELVFELNYVSPFSHSNVS